MLAVTVILALVKIVIVIGFLMSVTPVLTWAERRQSAMIQDRVGPNRAVVYLPRGIVLAIFGGAGVALALLTAYGIGWFGGIDRQPQLQAAVALSMGQIGVFLTWLLCVIVNARAKGSRDANAIEKAIASVPDP